MLARLVDKKKVKLTWNFNWFTLKTWSQFPFISYYLRIATMRESSINIQGVEKKNDQVKFFVEN